MLNCLLMVFQSVPFISSIIRILTTSLWWLLTILVQLVYQLSLYFLQKNSQYSSVRPYLHICKLFPQSKGPETLKDWQMPHFNHIELLFLAKLANFVYWCIHPNRTFLCIFKATTNNKDHIFIAEMIAWLNFPGSVPKSHKKQLAFLLSTKIKLNSYINKHESDQVPKCRCASPQSNPSQGQPSKLLLLDQRKTQMLDQTDPFPRNCHLR